MVMSPPVSRGPVLSSLALQAGAVGALLLAPLIWVEALPPAPIVPPPVIAPRIQAVKVFAAERIMKTAATLLPALLPQRRVFTAPAVVPKGTPNIIDAPAAFLETGIGSGVATGVPSGGIFPTTGEIIAAPPPPQPVPEKPKPAAVAPLRVSSGVQAAKLVAQVRPAYPALARQARIQGSVRLQATIARDGSIQQLAVLAGHPLLVASAVDAVKQWRYSPTFLNGAPVEVLTQIDVHFTLGQ